MHFWGLSRVCPLGNKSPWKTNKCISIKKIPHVTQRCHRWVWGMKPLWKTYDSNPHGSLMYNKISGWQVIWSNFTSNMILYRLKLTLLHRYSNIQFQWYIESTSSRHALSDGCFNLKRRSWRHWPAMKAPSTLLSVPNGNEVLEGCSRNLVNMMET